MDADSFSRLVQRIHDAALEPDDWHGALSELGAEFRSDQLLFYCRDTTAPGPLLPLRHHGIPAESAANLMVSLSTGVMPDWIRSLPTGVADRSSNWASDDDFARSAFYNEAVRPLGTFYAAMALLPSSPRQAIYFIAARNLGSADFDDGEIAKLQLLIPHLTTAFRTSERLASANLRSMGASVVLDRLHTGVILVDAAGAIVFANHAAETLLARGDGITTEAGRITTRHTGSARKLQKLLARCLTDTRAGSGSIDVPRNNGRSPLSIHVAPARSQTYSSEMAWLGTARAGAILIVTDPEAERSTRKHKLRRHLGLTNAEADVALEIIKGGGREAVAARLGVSLSTVRTHLSHIFEKAGVHRQAELVGIISGLLVPAASTSDQDGEPTY